MTLYLLKCIKYHTDKNQQRCSTKELREAFLHIKFSNQCRIIAMKAINNEPGSVIRDITVSI